MKLVIASDIHGAAEGCQSLMREIDRLHPDKIVLLGDLLYHGPRNDLPADYDPKHVIALLNEHSSHIVAVRGNCEAEVDQMVLDFPCMAPYNTLFDPSVGATLFLTHGHLYGPGLHNSVRNMPRLGPADVLVYGHTHIKVDEIHEDIRCFNPGSVGIPKDGSRSFAVYEDGVFTHCLL